MLVGFIALLSISKSYSETTKEINYVNLLSEKVRKILASHKQPSTLQILCLACYRPLHNFDWATKLKQSDNLKELLKKDNNKDKF